MALRIWNPFKPHVAKLTEHDAYVVRKLGIGGWEYKEVGRDYWYISPLSVINYCIYYNPTDAAQEAVSKKKSFARLYAY